MTRNPPNTRLVYLDHEIVIDGITLFFESHLNHSLNIEKIIINYGDIVLQTVRFIYDVFRILIILCTMVYSNVLWFLILSFRE